MRLETGNAADLLVRVIALGFLAGMLLSPRLWLLPHAFPPVPLPPLPALPQAESVLFGWLLLLALLLCLLQPRRPLWLLSTAGLSGLLMLVDLMHCQPWAYMYALLLLAAGLLRSSQQPLSAGLLLTIVRLALAGTYFYSGLQKLNPLFGTEVVTWLLQPVSDLSALWGETLTQAFTAGAPWLEALCGLALLIRPLRWLGVVGVGCMHLFLLAMLGPWALNWNSVVWPWNVVLPLLAVLTAAAGWPERLPADPTPSPAADLAARSLLTFTCLLFVALPALSFWNLWPAYFSAALYCGNITKGFVELSDEVRAQLPLLAQASTTALPEGRWRLDIYAWSFREFNTPPFPESLVFLRVAREVRTLAPTTMDVEFYLEPRLRWGETQRQRVYVNDRLLQP